MCKPTWGTQSERIFFHQPSWAHRKTWEIVNHAYFMHLSNYWAASPVETRKNRRRFYLDNNWDGVLSVYVLMKSKQVPKYNLNLTETLNQVWETLTQLMYFSIFLTLSEAVKSISFPLKWFVSLFSVSPPNTRLSNGWMSQQRTHKRIFTFGICCGNINISFGASI